MVGNVIETLALVLAAVKGGCDSNKKEHVGAST